MIAMLFCGLSITCTDDGTLTKEDVSANYLKVARTCLQDSIVLNATAMMGTVNKTCLDEGCPMKYFLKWKDTDTLNIQIINFSVGKMPVNIDFSINATFMKLNTWEKDEYGDENSGWIKFKGYNGMTDYMGNANSEQLESGTGGSGTVIGYFNAKSHEIEFVTNFNVMNFTADVYRQVIDTSRMATFDEDFAKYEEDLIQCKKDNGLL